MKLELCSSQGCPCPAGVWLSPGTETQGLWGVFLGDLQPHLGVGLGTALGCSAEVRGTRGTQRALPASAALCFCFMLTNSCCNVRPNYYLLLCSSLFRCVCAPGMTPDSCVTHAEMAGQLQLVPLGIFQQLVGCHCAVHSAPCLTFFPY